MQSLQKRHVLSEIEAIVSKRRAAFNAGIAAVLQDLSNELERPRKEPKRDSKLTGAMRTQELLEGSESVFRAELGMFKPVFTKLLEALGLQDSRWISKEERLAVFLSTCVSGSSGQRQQYFWQHSGDTISSCFYECIDAALESDFYDRYVIPPGRMHERSFTATNDPRFTPFFDNVIGAMDGTHVEVKVKGGHAPEAYVNRHGKTTHNVLAVCDFHLRFQYILAGWEGSMSDSALWNRAHSKDLEVPAGKLLLADAGFGMHPKLLVPFRATRYHLREWSTVGERPRNAQELYNLRHASRRNVVERIFGVLKMRFKILRGPSDWKLEYQVKILPALAAIHNFIVIHDGPDVELAGAQWDIEQQQPKPSPAARGRKSSDTQNTKSSSLSQGNTTRAEIAEATALRNKIATDMWQQYQQTVTSRSMPPAL